MDKNGKGKIMTDFCLDRAKAKKLVMDRLDDLNDADLND